jgi:probable HAF family extracellular repeat protein
VSRSRAARLQLLGLEDRIAPASFQGLGDLPGGDFGSAALGVSADASVVVGYGTVSSGAEAFRWTAGGGMVGLGDLPGGSFWSNAVGASADGSVVVGWGTGSSGDEAFQWTAGGGMAGLGDLPGGSFASYAQRVSADGSVVVGQGTGSSSGYQPFRWTAGGGMVDLGALPGGGLGGDAYGVSADGSVVVGDSLGSSGREAFRWTAGAGMVGLGFLAGGHSSVAEGVSADGSVVVGYGQGSLPEAFRWTAGGGIVGLGFLPGGTSSEAVSVSADGFVVVGQSSGGAFRWTATDGMRSIHDILVNDYGLGSELTGWNLRHVRACSADGSVIVGDGVNPAGGTEAWVARLDSSAPTVAGVQVNDGSAQRSRVTSLQVTFSTLVSFATTPGAAFTLTRNSDAAAVGFTATASVVGGVTVVTLNGLTGSATEFGSLADGRYTLTALASQISAGGVQMTSNYTFGDTQGLFRMFGDVNGDRVINGLDFGYFKSAFGTQTGDPNYLSYLDFDGDGVINGFDFGQFRTRFGTSLP